MVVHEMNVRDLLRLDLCVTSDVTRAVEDSNTKFDIDMIAVADVGVEESIASRMGTEGSLTST